MTPEEWHETHRKLTDELRAARVQVRLLVKAIRDLNQAYFNGLQNKEKEEE